MVAVLVFPTVLNFTSVARGLATDDFLPADLGRTEAENMNRFASNVRGFYDQFQTLKKDSKPDTRQIDTAQAKLKEIKVQLPAFQSDLRSLVTKLKSAGKWTAELDSYFENTAINNAQNREFVDFVKRKGGVRVVIEKCIGALGRFSTELDENERDLNGMKPSRIGSINRADLQIIPVSYAVQLIPTSSSCVIHTASSITCAMFRNKFTCTGPKPVPGCGAL
jgi:hypothetical protein